MKKLTLFMYDSDAELDHDLTLLGNLGVMHVTPSQPSKDESIERVDRRRKQMRKALGILDNYDDITSSNTDIKQKDYSKIERGEIEFMEDVLHCNAELVNLKFLKKKQRRSLRWYYQWGDVSVTDLNKLKERGVYIKLYELDNRELKTIEENENVMVFGNPEDELKQVVLISENESDKLDFDEVELPNYDFEDVKKNIQKTVTSIDKITDTLAALNEQKPLLVDALAERTRRFDVRNIQYGGINIDRQVKCFEGFIPETSVDKIVNTAKEQQWGYVIEDPSKEDADNVPTLVESPQWAQRIKPVMDFMGLVPGYNEMDVSAVFMLFFTFFTGILVGDAGYGLVFLLLTFIVHAKMKFKSRIEVKLFYTLGMSILFWGVITGTYFGSEAIANIPILSKLTIDKLASIGGDSVYVQKVMFMIGAIHLSVGHLQVAFRYINRLKAISEIGWVSVVWGLYFIVSQMVLGVEAPDIMLWLFVGGAALIILFSSTNKNFFKGMLGSIGNLPLSIINGFSDIISYIRLYAVGLSTVLMASSFNDMAIGNGISSPLAAIGAILILVLGHSLNMVLAGMAVIVHGVRLNMLEYAGHAGVEFSGNEYNPFKIKNSKNKK